MKVADLKIGDEVKLVGGKWREHEDEGKHAIVTETGEVSCIVDIPGEDRRRRMINHDWAFELVTSGCVKTPDEGKPRVELVPAEAILAAAKVFAYGSTKPGRADDNWRACSPEQEKLYVAATLRHIYAHMMGEANDPDSGRPHLDHAMTGLMILSTVRGKR